MTLKKFVMNCVPPILLEKTRKMRGFVVFDGDFKTWANAQAHSTGYDAPLILSKVRNAVQQVVDGKAAYERDSVVFQTLEYEMPLLACLLYVAASNDQRLTVADFGGSLGSTYLQHRSAIPVNIKLRWNVVELPHFVKCGRENYTTDQLAFYDTLEECEAAENPDVILLSSVLHYLPDPHAFMRSLLKLKARFILIDKTPLFDSPDRLTVQNVPSSIYKASYPAWFLNASRLLNEIADRFKPMIEFDSVYAYRLDGQDVKLRGTLLVRNE